jgi:hypothetical protein
VSVDTPTSQQLGDHAIEALTPTLRSMPYASGEAAVFLDQRTPPGNVPNGRVAQTRYPRCTRLLRWVPAKFPGSWGDCTSLGGASRVSRGIVSERRGQPPDA